MKKYNLPTINQKAETVILANGNFPTHPIPLSLLSHAEYIVCCDGAIDNLHQIGKEAHAIVGDCDSMSEESKQKFSSIIHPIAEQETNDLTKAIHFCLRQARKKIIILGATGKREDHTLGNISLLAEYMQEADVQMVTNYGVFVPIDKDSEFECFTKQKVSLFSIDSAIISSENLTYPIHKQSFTNWWQATLNEALANNFLIETTGRVIVYRAFE